MGAILVSTSLMTVRALGASGVVAATVSWQLTIFTTIRPDPDGNRLPDLVERNCRVGPPRLWVADLSHLIAGVPTITSTADDRLAPPAARSSLALLHAAKRVQCICGIDVYRRSLAVALDLADRRRPEQSTGTLVTR